MYSSFVILIRVIILIITNHLKYCNIIYWLKKIEGKKVILFDDIYTTGSTANECCKILSVANPKQIDVFTIAKD